MSTTSFQMHSCSEKHRFNAFCCVSIALCCSADGLPERKSLTRVDYKPIELFAGEIYNTQNADRRIG